MKEIFLQALLLISLLTTATVEALKKIFEEKKVSYQPTVLAVIVSAILSIAVTIGYLVYTSTPFTAQIGVIAVSLLFLSFLCATNGYDKIKEIIKQVIGG